MSKINSALAAAALLMLGAGAAMAQTPPAAEGDAKGRLAACRPALEQLCANVEKGGGRKIKCLKENEAKLTPECKTALDAAVAAHAAREAAKGAGPAAPVQK